MEKAPYENEESEIVDQRMSFQYPFQEAAEY